MNNIRRKIILVDDVNMHLLATKDRLKSHYEIYPAQTAEKLFEILEFILPDVILLDINMPDMDGFDIIKKIKEDSRFENIPVIFLTGKKDKKSIIQGMNLGAADIVFKPYSTDMLIHRIEYLFDPSKQEAERPIILAIDDDPSILQSVHQLLKDTYSVRTLVKPETMSECLKLLIPDLFLLDFKMPGTTGFDLVPIIREFPEHVRTPIVFLTSEGTTDHLSVALSLGACDFIVKPIDEKVLKERVAANLKNFRTIRLMRTLDVKEERLWKR